MTSGRTGSTALIDYLAEYDDIAVPHKNIDCRDNELLHPKHIQTYAKQYSKLCHSPIRNQDQLIDKFFSYNQQYPYAGFKSMPRRHKNYDAFIQRKDIQFIVLTRRDISSTIASFVLAVTIGSWRRHGEPQTKIWLFRPQDANRVIGHLKYIHKSRMLLSRIKSAVQITYEDLCSPSFSNPKLDDYFARPIKIRDPKPPTCAKDYIVNWEDFDAFVRKQYLKLCT